MMRTNKKERKTNAKKFYSIFMNSNCNKAAVVVNRMKSTNPNICRCQFITVPSTMAFMDEPVVIAESNLGIEGCFRELLTNIKNVEQKPYYNNHFNVWLKETYGFEITYRDGLVFMLEKD